MVTLPVTMPKKNKSQRRQAKTLRVAASTEAPIHTKDQAWLLVIAGAEVDLGRHVRCDRPITLGRDPDATLSLSDESTSWSHCSVVRVAETGRYNLIDLGSTNGTIVNGVKIQERVALSEGDKIFLGESVVRFSFGDAVDLRYQERLEEIVTTDPLTGMLTKRQYDATFAKVEQTARTSGSFLSVMVMDMDGLKKVNDTHGHEMGGFIIVEVSTIIRKVLDQHGHLCRFGGDEFVGCFPGLESDRALRLAQEVRLRVEEHHFESEGRIVHPTISMGVATYPDQVQEASNLFRAADRALYRAKGAGRNRVESAASEEHT
jgi:two-component system cell cycle response regulator